MAPLLITVRNISAEIYFFLNFVGFVVVIDDDLRTLFLEGKPTDYSHAG